MQIARHGRSDGGGDRPSCPPTERAAGAFCEPSATPTWPRRNHRPIVPYHLARLFVRRLLDLSEQLGGFDRQQ